KKHVPRTPATAVDVMMVKRSSSAGFADMNGLRFRRTIATAPFCKVAPRERAFPSKRNVVPAAMWTMFFVLKTDFQMNELAHPEASRVEGENNRYVGLSPKLLELLRQY